MNKPTKQEIEAKTLPIKLVVFEIFTGMRDEFHCTTLIRLVKAKLPKTYGEKKHTTDGTILRRLRQLRSEKKINYEVISPLDGLYRKLTPNSSIAA